MAQSEARRESKRKWLAANRERVRDTQRKWNEANPDKIRAIYLRRLEKDHEVIKRRIADYRKTEKGKRARSEWHKEWRAKNTEKTAKKYAREKIASEMGVKAAAVPAELVEVKAMVLQVKREIWKTKRKTGIP